MTNTEQRNTPTQQDIERAQQLLEDSYDIAVRMLKRAEVIASRFKVKPA